MSMTYVGYVCDVGVVVTHPSPLVVSSEGLVYVLVRVDACMTTTRQ